MYCDLWTQYIQVRKLFKGGNYSRAETIRGNTVYLIQLRQTHLRICKLKNNSFLLIYLYQKKTEIVFNLLLHLSTFLAFFVHTVFPRIVSALKQFPPLNSFRTCMYCHQRSQYIRLNSKKNSFRGNYSRKYGKRNKTSEFFQSHCEMTQQEHKL